MRIDFNRSLVARMELPTFLERYGSKVSNAIEFWQSCYNEYNKEDNVLQEDKDVSELNGSEHVNDSIVERKGSSKRNRSIK